MASSAPTLELMKPAHHCAHTPYRLVCLCADEMHLTRTSARTHCAQGARTHAHKRTDPKSSRAQMCAHSRTHFYLDRLSHINKIQCNMSSNHAKAQKIDHKFTSNNNGLQAKSH